MEQFKTVQKVAKENKCDERTVQNWCLEHNVPYVGSSNRKQYLIYPEYEEGFKNREKPGRRWPDNKTKKKK